MVRRSVHLELLPHSRLLLHYIDLDFMNIYNGSMIQCVNWMPTLEIDMHILYYSWLGL